MSIPFTWLLPEAKARCQQISWEWDKVVVGGPAVKLMPNYFYTESDFVEEGDYYPGVLQKINPEATRTTIGCIRNCEFCGVGKIEPNFEELETWTDRPILMDNNILACSERHFDLVCDKLEKWGWCDFNQGIDARLLTAYHAKRFKRIGKPKIRLALDNKKLRSIWSDAFDVLLKAGIQKHYIYSYCLMGFNDNPEIAWENCKFIESFGVDPLPMWFHELNALKPNTVTEKQEKKGWTDYERRRIMQWFYQHKKAVKN